MCIKRFKHFTDLELHIKKEHSNNEEHKCNQCEKSFVTRWRLRKHTRIHSEQYTKSCKYFIRSRSCPFEELGCKFSHDMSRKDAVDLNDDTTEDMNNDENGSNDSMDESESLLNSFFTSTPKSVDNCHECLNNSECTYCFARQVLGKPGVGKKIFF